MITIEDQTTYSDEVESIEIVRVEHEGGYRLHLWFADLSDHSVDFAPFLLHARNPMTTKYQDLSLFQNFALDHGNLHWNNYEMCFETAFLYENRVVEYNGLG
jgi:hypothetical protein